MTKCAQFEATPQLVWDRSFKKFSGNERYSPIIITASVRHTSSPRWLMPFTRHSSNFFPSASLLPVISPWNVTVSPLLNGVMARISRAPAPRA
jgi:hypothetical protein